MAAHDAGVQVTCPGCGLTVLQKAMIPLLGADGQGIRYMCPPCARALIVPPTLPGSDGSDGSDGSESDGADEADEADGSESDGADESGGSESGGSESDGSDGPEPVGGTGDTEPVAAAAEPATDAPPAASIERAADSGG